MDGRQTFIPGKDFPDPVSRDDSLQIGLCQEVLHHLQNNLHFEFSILNSLHLSVPSGATPRVIRFGVYEADLRSGELRKHGVRLKLQDQPFQVLCMLLERPGELVTREELRQRLWPADTFVDFDHGLNTAVNKLRDVLGDSAANPKFIETLAKRGYRYVGPQPAAVQTDAAAELGSAKVRNCETAKSAADTEIPQVQVPGGESPSIPQFRSSALLQSSGPLPSAHRGTVRTLFALVQVMYLGFYIAALAQLPEVNRLASELVEGAGHAAETVALITGSIGIAVRLYLLTAVIFDYQPLGWKFKRIFFFILILDFFWALSPYLLTAWIGFGLATACCAALLYLPFSQRTLIRMAYASDHRNI
jgi:DNA-binding winged helix-turn-helix (wHTH) protein